MTLSLRLVRALLGCACAASAAFAGEDKETTVVPVPKVAVLPAAKDWVTSLAFSPDGKTLAVGSKESVMLITVEDQKIRSYLDNLKGNLKGQVRALAFSPDGNRLAIGCYQSLQLWDVETAE